MAGNNRGVNCTASPYLHHGNSVRYCFTHTRTNEKSSVKYKQKCLHKIDVIKNRITSPPKVIWEECVGVATPDGRECTRPLRVLAVQCSLQTSPFTQPWVTGYATPLPHQSLNITVPNRNVDSNDILSIQKYCQLFTHESSTFLLKNTPLKPMGQWGQNTPETASSP